jgi:diguanylate cyclase (GGDEF)-like protein/PAS domain S-box-containing protein
MLDWVRRILLTTDEDLLRAEVRATPAAVLPEGELDYVPGSEPAPPTGETPAASLTVPVMCEGRQAGRLVFRGAAPAAATEVLLARIVGIIEAVLCTAERARGSEAERENHEAYFEQLFAAAPEAIAVLDRHDRVVRTNRSFLELFGYTEEEVVGRTVNELIVPPELHEEALELTRRVASGGYVREETIRRRRDGTQIHVSILATPIVVHGDQVAVYGMYRDITAQKESEEALRRLSTTDDLTGLYNRRGFFLLAEQQRRLALRRKADMLLLYIDVDDFKHVNDTYGHVVGDRVLAELALLLQRCYRETDIVARVGEDSRLLARMGGDEFVVLAIDPGVEGERILRVRLRDRLAEYNRSGKAPCPISLSIGAVLIPPDPAFSLDSVIAEADRRMYVNKRDGT